MPSKLQQLFQLAKNPLKYPVIQAPMYHYSGAELVIAASKAGLLGSLSCQAPEKLEGSLDRIKRELGGGDKVPSVPYAVNLFLLPDSLTENQPSTPPSVLDLLRGYKKELGLDMEKPVRKDDSYKELIHDQVTLLKRYRVPSIIFTFGIPPASMITDLKRNHDCVLIGSATTISEAHSCQDAGLDAVILQGIEAGGHRTSPCLPTYGLEGLTSLLTRAPSLSIPYIAAGGLVSHTSIKSALDQGADGCSLGSLFLLSKECSTPPAHRRLLAQSWTNKDATTVLTRCFTGRPARMIPNRFYKEVLECIGGNEGLIPWNFYARDVFGDAARRGRDDLFVVWSGQSFAGSSVESRPVAEIVDGLRLDEL